MGMTSKNKKSRTVSRITSSFRGLPLLSNILCSDNSGGIRLVIISVLRWGSRLNRIPCCSVGDLVSVTVKKGKADIVGKVSHSIIIRQKSFLRRIDGSFVSFEDNSAII